ncbi:phosphotransferase [Polymorphobacter sp.]|uniref:phosphotransferase n=1 Tax=Polymorphobacter sp. TaxID=1909290 RepID=UPI003F719C83
MIRLLTSGAYVGAELQAEFGRVPPAFLPVGGSLLIHHQLQRLGATASRTILSLPDDFVVDPIETGRLAAAGVEIVAMDPRLSLGRSVAKLIAAISEDSPIEIIHGDTLIDCLPAAVEDAMSIGEASDGYHWATVSVVDGCVASVANEVPVGDPQPGSILSGAFRFSDPALLLRCLVDADDSFVAALDAYARRRQVAAVAMAGWLDFGHLQTFFRSRHHLAASRHFNSLRITDGVVHKSSDQRFKMAAEASWLRTLPASLQLYSARLIEDDSSRTGDGYATEYAYLPTVAEIYLSRLNARGWQRILGAMTGFVEAETRCRGEGVSTSLATLGIEKTRARLEAARDVLPALDAERRIGGQACPAPSRMLEELFARIAAAPPRPPSIMHGDLCFSNILYNSRNQRICVIDPRGYVEDGRASAYGDTRYDLAKLAHSIIGRYDQILGGQYRLDDSAGNVELTLPADPVKDALEHQFLEQSVDGIAFDSDAVIATMITLFFSMIPLHREDPRRQRAFFANGAQLFMRFYG